MLVRNNIPGEGILIIGFSVSFAEGNGNHPIKTGIPNAVGSPYSLAQSIRQVLTASWANHI